MSWVLEKILLGVIQPFSLETQKIFSHLGWQECITVSSHQKISEVPKPYSKKLGC